MTMADTLKKLHIPDDGRFFAAGRTVLRAPIKSKALGEPHYEAAKPICTLSNFVSDQAAEKIAAALNKALAAGDFE